MAKSGISVMSSRFSILTVEDDDNDNNETQDTTLKQNVKANAQNAAAKKKNKKKKKQHDANLTEELKQMAFGKPIKQHRDGDKGCSVKPDSNPKQWKEWKEKDEEFTKESYHKDLEQALLISKQNFEMETQRKKENGTVNGVEAKKKKKKDKAPAMSLEQFNQMEFKSEKPIDSEDEDSPEPIINPPVIKTSIGEGDTHFFDKVDDDVHKIISREKIQEEYKKHYAIESAMTLKYQEELSKKDTEITDLKSTLSKLQEEFKQVKKRNKQLCVILAQGEMKDKAQALMQIEDLTQIRNELTEQVSNLNGELEKEKSKVHGLKLEVEKLKGGKHHSK